jgi:hypothetical protein
MSHIQIYDRDGIPIYNFGLAQDEHRGESRSNSDSHTYDRNGIPPYIILAKPRIKSSAELVTATMSRLPVLSLTTIIPNRHQQLLSEIREDTFNIRSLDAVKQTLVTLPWYVWFS